MKFIFNIYIMNKQDLARAGHDSKFKMAVMPIYSKKHSNYVLSGAMKHMGHLST